MVIPLDKNNKIVRKIVNKIRQLQKCYIPNIIPDDSSVKTKSSIKVEEGHLTVNLFSHGENWETCY